MRAPQNHRVVVTGLGAVTPIGIGLEAYWESLSHGRSGGNRISLFDVSNFSVQIACEVKDFEPTTWIPEKEVKRMDRFVQFGLAAGRMAVAQSGLPDTPNLNPERVGVLVGSGIGGLSTIEEQKEILMDRGPRRVTPFLIPMMISDMVSGALSIEYGFKGPNLALVTACATGNHALGEAARMVQRGEADVMIAGGAEAAITPLGLAGFSNMKALSRRNDEPELASRPFDKERDGFVAGEGAGVVVLESLEHAQARGAEIFAELAGYGQTGDAFHITAPCEDGDGAVRAMRLALADAELNPEDVHYLNAHGTSTPMNDRIETHAIKTVFGEHAPQLPVSSTKSMTGHLLGAAGGIEFIACCLMLQNNTLAPTINYTTPDPDCDLDYVPNTPREFSGRNVMSNTFGFGGHNAVLVVSRFES